jgi:hypothetical protein
VKFISELIEEEEQLGEFQNVLMVLEALLVWFESGVFEDRKISEY